MKPSVGTAKELNLKIWVNAYQNLNVAARYSYEPFMEIIAGLIRSRRIASVLDFACGSGNLGFHLVEMQGFKELRIDGVDIATQALPLAAQWYSNVHGTDGTHPPPGKTYDLICLNCVIEHIDKDPLDELLANLYESLNPGGTLFLVVPHAFSPRRIFAGREKEWKREREELGHVSFHTYASLHHLLKRHGFTGLRFSFPTRFRFTRLLTGARSRWLPLGPFWTILHLFPFYFLRDSYCLACVKPLKG